jgi:hypothetical protein
MGEKNTDSVFTPLFRFCCCRSCSSNTAPNPIFHWRRSTW